MNIFEEMKKDCDAHKEIVYSFEEYLNQCKKDPSTYATSAERMLLAIGEPTLVDTSKDARMSRIFMNRKIRTYESFADFYGMEETIESIVAYFKHAAQGLEERKQILYLLGPVGGGKSSLAEKLKELMEKYPFYTLRAYNAETGKYELSPVLESPLGLFDKTKYGRKLEETYGIPSRYLGIVPSPWATKRLEEFGNDKSKFEIVKMWPSKLKQVNVTKTEPGDENNQDISALVGKVDIHKLDGFSQDDPDAYNYSGGLNLTTQGLLEFVEMFKAPIKMLHPLLTATQEGNYNGTENFGAMPYQGIILAHSNLAEWGTFKNNKNNEAFLDRVYIVKVPYCLRVSEEIKIYQKLLSNSELSESPCAPGTLEMMARFSVLTRLIEPDNSTYYSKMEVYDGKNLKEVDPRAKSLQEYRDFAGVNEGMDGFSTRGAYKILSKVFNFDSDEVAANPVHLIHLLTKQIEQEQYAKEVEDKYVSFVKGLLAPKFAEFIGDEIQKAYLESYNDYGQNLFDQYIKFADAWIMNSDFRDPDTGELYDRTLLNAQLEKIEKAADISNPKDFRTEVVNFVLREKANTGKTVKWTSYEKLRNVIEKKMFSNTEDLLPVISFGKKANTEEERKHMEFVDRMVSKGYTEKQVRLLVEWYQRVRKNS